MKLLSCLCVASLTWNSILAQINQDSVDIGGDLRDQTRVITEFNEGNILHPLQLIQGRSPRLQIYRPGNSPGLQFHSRLRGVNTIMGPRSPLMVVDELYGMPLALIDPNSVDLVEIYDDGSSARWGMQGGGGVIRLSTLKPSVPEVSLMSFYAFEHAIVKDRPLPADKYRRIRSPSSDLGANRDWIEDITQTGGSWVNNLHMTAGSDKLWVNSFLDYRQNQAIQKNAGFTKWMGTVKIGGNLFDNRFFWDVTSRLGDENTDIGFSEAFRYALIYNPTDPGTNTAELFDYINPQSIIDDNNINRQQQLVSLAANLSYRWKFLEWYGFLGRFDWQNALIEKYDPRGQFRNMSSGKSLTEVENARWKTGIAVQTQLREIELKVDGSLESNLIHRLDTGAFIAESDQINEVRLFAYILDAELNWQGWYFSANNRFEGSSVLAQNQKWGNFYNYELGYALTDLWVFKRTRPSISLGKSGITPYRAGLSRMIIDQESPYFSPKHNANPSLKWEETRQFDIALELETSRTLFTIRHFSSISEDMLYPVHMDLETSLAPITNMNLGEFRTRGIFGMTSLNYGRSLEIGTSFYLSYQSSTYVNLDYNDGTLDHLPLAYPGSPGFGSGSLAFANEGSKIGTINGPEFIGFDGSDWQLEDVDGNGFAGDIEDYQEIGNGLPNWTLGWTQSFQWAKWRAGFLIRGSSGHQIASMSRLFYLNRGDQNFEVRNTIRGYKEIPSQVPFNRWSDFFVYDASYVRLQNLYIQYEIGDLGVSQIDNLRIIVAANDLITLSGYPGNDPEVRMIDPGTSSNGGYAQNENGNLVAGIDRRNSWYPVRSFSIGIQVSFH